MKSWKKFSMAAISSVLLITITAFSEGRPVRMPSPDQELLGALKPYGLPFTGPGRVFVLDDGTVALQIGARIGQPQSGVLADFDAWESFVFQPGTGGHAFSLVNVGTEWFFDSEVETLTRRGLTTNDVRIIPLEAGRDADTGRQSVLEIEGFVRIDFDPLLRMWQLRVGIEDGTEYFACCFEVKGLAAQTRSPRTPVPPCPQQYLCCVVCKNGTCWCSPNAGGGLCFCTIWGDAWCLCIAKFFEIVPFDVG